MCMDMQEYVRGIVCGREGKGSALLLTGGELHVPDPVVVCCSEKGAREKRRARAAQRRARQMGCGSQRGGGEWLAEVRGGR